MSDLSARKCEPCQGNIPALEMSKQIELLSQLNNWEIINSHHLSKNLTFPNFLTALEFVNKVGLLAEQQGHHPDIYLTWGKLRIEIWTHKIDGLTEADFILAAKIDQIK
jgi:4a-hydroxytetrahydrobiopterin dehydratase